MLKPSLCATPLIHCAKRWTWPTFPQLFINGELIGGCDITVELAESGELARLVADAQKA